MPHDPTVAAPVDPAETSTTFEEHQHLEDGIALCLSGGGYRAMLFHIGSLWRLNELGYLTNPNRIQSASRGSITARVPGCKSPPLAFHASGLAPAFAVADGTP